MSIKIYLFFYEKKKHQQFFPTNLIITLIYKIIYRQISIQFDFKSGLWGTI